MLNHNVNNLKLSKNGLPTWDSLFPHVLEFIINNKNEVSRIVIKKEVADSLNLSDNLRSLEYDSKYGGNVIENRIDFCISALKISGLIVNENRGTYSATSDGNNVFKKYGYSLDRKVVESTSQYVEYYKNKTTKNKEKTLSENEGFDLIESIEDQTDKLREEQKEKLLNTILKSSPYLFEQVVVDLLSKMGYKGKNGKSLVTKKSNDGGIDGIINQDPLGTQTVYIQAKRYSTNNVQRQEIQSFFGALRSINAQRGVFITTSDFSKPARDEAKHFSIILINGDDLLDLLIEHQIGIEIDRSFFTYKINEEFFEEE